MGQEDFKIIIQQLHDGKPRHIDFEADPVFMDLDEPELKFSQPVKIEGEYYIAGDELILHLDAATEAIIPCSICNQPVTAEISFSGVYHAVALEEIKNNVYEFGDVVRENLLLETPRYIECNKGKCPDRETMSRYFKKSSSEEDEGQRPFENL